MAQTAPEAPKLLYQKSFLCLIIEPKSLNTKLSTYKPANCQWPKLLKEAKVCSKGKAKK